MAREVQDPALLGEVRAVAAEEADLEDAEHQEEVGDVPDQCPPHAGRQSDQHHAEHGRGQRRARRYHRGSLQKKKS